MGGTMKRQHLLARGACAIVSLGALLFGGSVAGFGGSVAGASTTLTVTESGLFLTYAPLYIAQSKGYFARQHLAINIVNTPGGETAAAALFGGSAQVALDSTEHSIQATDQGTPLVAFAAVNSQETVAVVVSDSLWKTDHLADKSQKERIAALKGKNLGVISIAGENVLVFNELFHAIGTTPSKAGAQFITLGSPSAILSAFQSGKIDAFNLAPPFPKLVVSEGLGHVITDLALGQLPAVKGMVSDTFQATRSYVASHAAIVQRFTNAIAEAERWEAANSNAAAALLHKTVFSETSLVVLRDSMKEMVGAGAISPTPVISASGFRKVIGFLTLSGASAPSPSTLKSLYTNKFADKSLAQSVKKKG